MEKDIEIIQKYAQDLKQLEQSEQYLFDQLNSLNTETIEQLTEDFTSDEFRPVNLLRLDLLNKIKEKIILTPEIVEEVKSKIIEKDKTYFSKYGESLVEGLLRYSKGEKRSPFASWKNFSIFFNFFTGQLLEMKLILL